MPNTPTFYAYFLLMALVCAAALRLFVNRDLKDGLAPFSRESLLPLRGLLALIIIVGHCGRMLPDGINLPPFLKVQTPAVAVFFFLSGYGLAVSWRRHGDDYMNGFLKRSLLKLFVPFLLAMVCCIGYRVWLSPGGMAWGSILPNLRKGNPDLLLPHSWFVFSIVTMYVFFFLSFRFRRAAFNILSLFAFLVIYYISLKYFSGWKRWWWKTSLSLVAGTAWGCYEPQIRAVLARFGGWAYLAAVLAGGLVWFAAKIPALCDLRFWVMGSMVALAVYALPALPGTLFAVFAFLGTISYEIYLCHGILKLGLAGFASHPCLYIAAVMAGSVAMAWCLHAVNPMRLKKKK